ncbi:putative peroxidase-related enzyme [Pontibacter mucosus]|uniref:Putative peroxidase-related enzyme n=1 Tax=Pontibacter mucosus TaxID=1649266 RepID=A0A2T5YP17_9BACT|nr:carboxymuconolactone decarboxylase family protein [Pontibacter mucosus]PTX21059.1 putative peroxidase-related enzyme [Pontibacter mucosus]
MTYINTGIKQPGIVELLFYKNNTGNALSNLANALLIEKSPLSSGERELIASYVSYLNECEFCHLSHSAAANAHLGDNGKTVSCIIENIETANISEKLKQLLKIAGKVQKSGKLVTSEDIEVAKLNGAIDEEIHDTVLIAAAFCMFNRYVDGLGTIPATKEEYPEMGRRMSKGYKMPPNFLKKFILKLMKRNSDSGAMEHMKNIS